MLILKTSICHFLIALAQIFIFMILIFNINGADFKQASVKRLWANMFLFILGMLIANDVACDKSQICIVPREPEKC